MPFVIVPVDAAATFPLRQQVLRPHQTLEEVGLVGDHDSDAGHFAARLVADPAHPDQPGPIVGVVAVIRQHPPDSDAPDRERWWRLRGMATAAGARHQGIGRALVAAVVDHAASRGGTRLWCHARLPAVPFYRAVGFQAIGEEWVEPIIGPHIAMWRPLP